MSFEQLPPPAPMAPQRPVATTEKNSLGMWSLILGILSIIFLGFFAGIPAIILGIKSRKAAEQGRATNGGQGLAGLITGIIGTVLTSLGWLFFIVAVAALGGAVDAANKSASSALGSTSASITSSSSSSSDTSSSSSAPTLTPKDFTLKPVIKKKECFGSAGCNVTYRIDVTYNGSTPIPADATYEVTYEVTGAEDPITNTFTVSGDKASVDQEESTSTSSSRSVLRAKATAVEQTS